MHVALTGATGFLGLRLVRELLARHRKVTVLAHAESGGALHRIMRFYELTDAPQELTAELADRLRIVDTDLTQPQLGLSAAAYRELADGVDVVWHSAGNIRLDDDPARLRRVNVEGTRNVLALAAAGCREPVVHHVSTAFVAGARHEGVVYEDELDDGHGFENTYERSKYEAELLVRAWAREHRRPALVLRPSILVSDVPPHPELPEHPLQFIDDMLQTVLRGVGRPQADGAPLLVRLAGHPRAHLNLMPVEDTARVMVALGARERSGGVETYHVVHGHDVPIGTLTAVMERLAPVRVEVVAQRPVDASPLEAATDLYPGFTPYLHHRRRYDDTRVRCALGASPSRHRVDLPYLLSGVLPPQPEPASLLSGGSASLP
ncbi:SDR family oxidoreductase [Yinghuangia aomiensis]|uniref:SDR family oxidoreductase n=1 Tax=Yinghuangia aomiensis TaxID=676205 RepID=A0ABP9GZ84_9ACTN